MSRKATGEIRTVSEDRETRFDVKFSADITTDHDVIVALNGIESALRWLAFVVFVLGVAGIVRIAR